MKRLSLALLICCKFSIALGQIEVGVWTDKPSYRLGDTVRITVTAYNPNTDTAFLIFPSSCHANYIIDDYNLYDHVTCMAVITPATIPPLGSIRWDHLRYPFVNSPPLSQGSHTVVGEVLGYGRSDTLLIVVTSATSILEENIQADGFLLRQNYPNPFNGATSIPFTLSKPSRVVITLYNSLGQKIRTLLDEHRSTGSHVVRAELNDVSTGSYWCRLEVGNKTQTMKVIMSK